MLRRSAFTLIDLLVAISILAILAGMALPVFSTGATAQLLAAANTLASDIEYAQSLALSLPDDPAVVRVDETAGGWWVALQSDPEAPVVNTSGDGPYLVQMGFGDATHLAGVGIRTGSSSLVQFDGFGRLAGLVDATITLENAAGERRVRVAATTGVVTVE